MQTVNLDSRKVDIIQWVASLDDSVLLAKIEAFKNGMLNDSLEVPEKAMQAFIADAEQAHKDYEATGLHTTQDDMTKWLAELKTNPHAKVPQCHL